MVIGNWVMGRKSEHNLHQKSRWPCWSAHALDIEHFGFIQFYKDNWSVQRKKTIVFLFFEAFKLRQDLVNMGFFRKSTIVAFGAQRVKMISIRYTKQPLPIVCDIWGIINYIDFHHVIFSPEAVQKVYRTRFTKCSSHRWWRLQHFNTSLPTTNIVCEWPSVEGGLLVWSSRGSRRP